MSVSSRTAGAGGSKSAKRAVLPEVAGMHVDDARVVLTSAGFNVLKLHYVESYQTDYQVVKQEPGSGILVDTSREVRLEVARMNLVSYLPSAYQQATSPTGESFIKGFLYIIQSLSDQTSRRLDALDKLFDPRTTDPDFLPWLGSWLSIGLNRDWTELQTRQMLLAATRLFPYRGTGRAIAEFVKIYTDANVQIEENTWPFKGFKIGVHSTVGEDTVILPTMNLAHVFVVRLDRSAGNVPEDEIIRIHQIIQDQKPAHTAYFLAFSDEEAAGEMGAFMTIGSEGVGIVPPVGVVEEADSSDET
jgi:phage tail-like protein